MLTNPFSKQTVDNYVDEHIAIHRPLSDRLRDQPKHHRTNMTPLLRPPVDLVSQAEVLQSPSLPAPHSEDDKEYSITAVVGRVRTIDDDHIDTKAFFFKLFREQSIPTLP
jgi:hypothetical protein